MRQHQEEMSNTIFAHICLNIESNNLWKSNQFMFLSNIPLSRKEWEIEGLSPIKWQDNLLTMKSGKSIRYHNYKDFTNGDKDCTIHHSSYVNCEKVYNTTQQNRWVSKQECERNGKGIAEYTTMSYKG